MCGEFEVLATSDDCEVALLLFLLTWPLLSRKTLGGWQSSKFVIELACGCGDEDCFSCVCFRWKSPAWRLPAGHLCVVVFLASNTVTTCSKSANYSYDLCSVPTSCPSFSLCKERVRAYVFLLTGVPSLSSERLSGSCTCLLAMSTSVCRSAATTWAT